MRLGLLATLVDRTDQAKGCYRQYCGTLRAIHEDIIPRIAAEALRLEQPFVKQDCLTLVEQAKCLGTERRASISRFRAQWAKLAGRVRGLMESQARDNFAAWVREATQGSAKMAHRFLSSHERAARLQANSFLGRYFDDVDAAMAARRDFWCKFWERPVDESAFRLAMQRVQERAYEQGLKPELTRAELQAAIARLHGDRAVGSDL